MVVELPAPHARRPASSDGPRLQIHSSLGGDVLGSAFMKGKLDEAISQLCPPFADAARPLTTLLLLPIIALKGEARGSLWAGSCGEIEIGFQGLFASHNARLSFRPGGPLLEAALALQQMCYIRAVLIRLKCVPTSCFPLKALR